MEIKKDQYVAALTAEQIQDLMFQASRGANKQLFTGILPFLIKMNDDFETVIRELDYIKSYIQSEQDKPKQKKKVTPDMLDELVEQEKQARKYKKYEDE